MLARNQPIALVRMRKQSRRTTMAQDQTAASIFDINLRTGTIALVLLVMFAVTIATAPAQAQTFTVLHAFSGGGDGGLPQAGLTMDRADNLYGTTMAGGYTGTRCNIGCGTVFKLTRKNSGWIFSPLYGFLGGSDGADPQAGVALGPDGSLYGTTSQQGQQNGGTVFSLRPPPAPCRAALCPWTETVLYRFTGLLGTGDGYLPSLGDLIFDHAGNVYGTTNLGGANDQGTVYELTRSNGAWTESVLYSFGNPPDGQRPYSGVISDSAGNLYGTTGRGGNRSSDGTVFQLTPSGSGWTENILYTFQNRADGAGPGAGLIFDSAGNLYGITSYGGQYGFGTAYQLSPSSGSWTFSTIFNFADGGGSTASLTMDAAGNLYGTLPNAYPYDGEVFKLTPGMGGWTVTVLYRFGGGDDGSSPYGSVVLDADGNIYGTTEGGGAYGKGVVWEIMP
jgi:uncharacterized repeat protein (TIGR03803 family)